MSHDVRFSTARDGTPIAYSVHGHGAPLVRTATWLTHLEHDWKSPVWKHWLEALGERHTVLRYDERGCGLSDRDAHDFSLDTRVGDLEAVIDAAGFERFALLGMSQGGPVAIGYAARHAARVTHLVLFATYARGRLKRDPSPAAREQAKLLISLIRMGWGRDEPVFRRLYTTLFMPDATAEEMAWFDELQRVTTDPETAVLIRNARNDDEVTEDREARDHADARPARPRRRTRPVLGGPTPRHADPRRTLRPARQPQPRAARARSRLDRVPPRARRLPRRGRARAPARLPDLSERELAVLELVAEGLSNEEIATRLVISVRTVERHVSNVYAKLRLSGKAARAAAAARYVYSATPARHAGREVGW